MVARYGLTASRGGSETTRESVKPGGTVAAAAGSTPVAALATVSAATRETAIRRRRMAMRRSLPHRSGFGTPDRRYLARQAPAGSGSRP